MRHIGPEVPTLNEGWSFLGARLDEWLSGASLGLLYIIVIQSFFRSPQGEDGVVILVLVVGFTYLLRILRERFPDEKRGLMNKVCDLCGIVPPLLPPPASFRVYWSAVRVNDISKTEFAKLGFNKFLLARDSIQRKESEVRR
ncbi:MAG: hypothetical protein NZO16_00660 [Deltaproteobacteria bacterium]|nr:hypothetical protein [Deltaproteobacteria bacterium]